MFVISWRKFGRRDRIESQKNRSLWRLNRRKFEVISLIGDIGLINGNPVVHAHGVVGLPDGTTRGGHIISATVWPTLELFLTDEPSSLMKEEDPDTGLFLFNPEAALKQDAASPHYKHLELTVGELLEEPFEVNILSEVLSIDESVH